METQVKMAHGNLEEEEGTKEITEEQFLKDLYLFMKKRETPIERIPHLGFKQIDLFVMFKTVNDLGGYHQVTAQQLWKKVYNTLGGNPRSTSAATCTRRHYEKLLLPYECHVKGIILSAVPHHQPKAFHYPAFIREEEDDGQRASKRKLLSIPLHQSPLNLQSNPTRSLIPLPLFHHFYPPIHSVLPPFSPISSLVLTPPPTSSAPPKPPQPPLHPPPLTPSEPLEHLRYLAERYKSSSGLAEPLNLSTRASSRQADSNPVSSFAPPASSKMPKFLNKPSSLYSPHHARTVRSDETQDGMSTSDGVQSHPEVKSPKFIDVDAITASSNPACDGEVVVTAHKPGSPKTDFTARSKEERQEAIALQQGKMEIEIPLSMFQNWLQWCSSPAKYPPLPAQEEGRRADTIPANLTFHMNPLKQSSAENPMLRNEPSPPPYTGQTSANHSNTGQMYGNHQNMEKTSRNDSNTRQMPGNHHNTYTTTNLWDVCSRESPTSPVQVKADSSPIRTQQDFASKISTEDVVQPSALLMLNSSPASVLHLTTEEVMKLKKIISSSS